MQRNDVTQNELNKLADSKISSTDKIELKKLEKRKQKGKDKIVEGTADKVVEGTVENNANNKTTGSKQNFNLYDLNDDLIYYIMKQLSYQAKSYNSALKMLEISGRMLNIFLNGTYRDQLIYTIDNPYYGSPTAPILKPTDPLFVPQLIQGPLAELRKLEKHSNEISESIRYAQDDTNTLLATIRAKKVEYKSKAPTVVGMIIFGIAIAAWAGLTAWLSYMGATTPDKQIINNPDYCSTVEEPTRVNCTDLDDYAIAGLVTGLVGLIPACGGAAIILILLSICCKWQEKKPVIFDKKEWKKLLADVDKLYRALCNIDSDWNQLQNQKGNLVKPVLPQVDEVEAVGLEGAENSTQNAQTTPAETTAQVQPEQAVVVSNTPQHKLMHADFAQYIHGQNTATMPTGIVRQPVVGLANVIASLNVVSLPGRALQEHITTLSGALNMLSILMKNNVKRQLSGNNGITMFSNTQASNPHTVVTIPPRPEIRFDHSDKATEIAKVTAKRPQRN